MNNSAIVEGGAIYDAAYGRFSMSNTIVAFSEGEAIYSYGLPPHVLCCDIYGNTGGDWVGGIADQLGVNGNICEDPLFCAPDQNDLNLDCASPCTAENNPGCGQIGAWPVGCGATPAVEATWGALKELFGR